MLKIDLTGKRAFVAGVADDGGFGFAIAKAMAEAGATICLGTWPPAMGIFMNLLERGKIDESLKLIVAGDISPATRETLMKQIDETKANDSVAKVVGLILGTPEFQRQ